MKSGAQEVKPQARVWPGMLWGLLILVLMGVSGLGIRAMLRPPAPPKMLWTGSSRHLPVYASVPDFSLVERSGQQVGLANLRDKIWIVDFMFTHCRDECPLMSSKMAALQVEFTRVEDIRLVSITVDPERDTPAVLSGYADRFGADPERWLFLTGEKASIYRLAQEGFRVSVMDPQTEGHDRPLALGAPGRGDDPVHATRFALVDRRARIRGYYDSREEEALHRLRQHVNALLRDE